MYRFIIADTSCLILFDKIGVLELLHRTYEKITLTPEVAREYGRQLPEWINIVEVKNKEKQGIRKTCRLR